MRWHLVLRVIFASVLAVLLPLSIAAAQSQADQQARPPKVEEFLKLLGDTDVQKWIDAQKAVPAQSKPAPAPEVTLANVLARIRGHISELVATVPALPAEIAAAASRIADELEGRGFVWMILLFAIFVGVGLAAQWLFWHWSGGLRARIAHARFDTVGERLIAIAARLVFGATYVLAFAAGSIGAFLAFTWPPVIGEILLGYLIATLIYRMASVVLEFLLSPPRRWSIGDAERFRIIPMSSEAATFWTRRLSYATGWFAFGWITVSLLQLLGFSRPSQQLIAYLLGLGLLAIGLEAVWRRPGQQTDENRERLRRLGARTKTWLLTIYFVLLWLLWVAGMTNLFWLAVTIVGLPAAMAATQKAVNNILRLPGTASGGTEVPSVLAAVVERGVRALLIVAAVLILAQGWGVDLTELAANDTIAMRAARGLFSAVIVLLLADFVWHVTKTVIDRKLVEVGDPSEVGSEDARRRSRVRTLLPILRNILMIAVAVVAVLMALSSMGVAIGPLIAGAGIIGVAVGFGAQTVVKDVISGMFYLLDDAFRVGEYIQSGSYMGTVESFSLRSVKLRHHRGAIFIVPFSELGAVQNMSRDWVIEKIMINVTYDSDVEKARKIIKKIGLELAEDPEFAPSTLQPLKMQGVTFGDFAMVISMKVKTRPGEQFGIKRRALMMIKEAFAANGIKIAVPTVQVAGGGDDVQAAAAHHVQEMQKKAAQAT